MQSKVENDIQSFLKGSIADMIESIDLDSKELLPKKSEDFVESFLKDTKGQLVKNETVHKIMHCFVRFAKRKGFRKLLVLGGFGMGKSFCQGNQVLTYDGNFKKVEDVVVGDKLMGPDSRPRNVLFLGRGKEEAYRVTLSNKDFFTCNKSHKISLKFRRDAMGYLKGDILNICVAEYLELPDWIKKYCLRMYKVPVDFKYIKTPENPYEYGKNKKQEYSIDTIYLINSREIRLHVLAGYLDIHGNVDKCTSVESYMTVTKSILLRENLLFLCRSLGFSVNWGVEVYNNINFYRITISGDVQEIPCKIKKIEKVKRNRKKRESLEYSFKVESIGEKEYFGFGLNKDHLFLLHDFTVSHNTEQLCIGYTMYRIAKNPNILVKLVHVSEEESIKRCRALRDYIQKDEELHEMAPHLIPTPIWGSKRFIVKREAMSKDGTVEAYGILSTSIGGRANLMIFDDPQDLKSAVHEPSTRKKIEDTFKNVWITRMIPDDSEMIVTMNKWHENDIASVIQKNPTWAWMCIAVTADINNLEYKDSFGRKYLIPLWSKFGKKDLLDRKIDLGDRDFDRGYRLIPYSDSDKTFPSFEKCCHYGVDPLSIVQDGKDWIFVGGIDFSGLKRPGTILSLVAAHRTTGMKIPIAIAVLRSSAMLIDVMVKWHQEWGVDLFIAENNGVQDAIIDLMVSALGDNKYKRYGIKIEGFLTGRNKADTLIGLPSLNKEFENQEWMFCFAQSEKFSYSDDFKTNPWSRLYFEMYNHPFYETTDMVMSLWFCREGIKNIFRNDTGPHIY